MWGGARTSRNPGAAPASLIERHDGQNQCPLVVAFHNAQGGWSTPSLRAKTGRQSQDESTGTGLILVGAEGKPGDGTEDADGVRPGGLVGSHGVAGGASMGMSRETCEGAFDSHEPPVKALVEGDFGHGCVVFGGRGRSGGISRSDAAELPEGPLSNRFLSPYSSFILGYVTEVFPLVALTVASKCNE